jgi:hypothetical protein
MHCFHGGYWRAAYGDFPWPTINHWQNLEVVLKQIDIEQTSNRMRSWWATHKKQLRETLRNTVLSQFGQQAGRSLARPVK